MTRTSPPRRRRGLALIALVVGAIVLAVVRDRALARDAQRFTSRYGPR